MIFPGSLIVYAHSRTYKPHYYQMHVTATVRAYTVYTITGVAYFLPFFFFTKTVAQVNTGLDHENKGFHKRKEIRQVYKS